MSYLGFFFPGPDEESPYGWADGKKSDPRLTVKGDNATIWIVLTEESNFVNEVS